MSSLLKFFFSFFLPLLLEPVLLLLELSLLGLSSPQHVILSLLSEEFVVGSLLVDHTVFEDDDFVTLLDGGKPVSDHERSGAFRGFVDGTLDVSLCVGV